MALQRMGVRLRGDLLAHLVIEEEVGGNGTLAFARRGERADGCIVMEPTELRVLTLTSLAAGSVTIYWNSIPGRTYRLVYEEALTEGPWNELPGDVVATGYTSSKNDPAGGQPARFYRVKML